MTASSDNLEHFGDDDQGAADSEIVQPTAAAVRLFHSITLRNLLSFSSENEPLELKNLNVLIGPNGSGKSNLLETIRLLRAATSDLRPVLSQGGGVGEWIWKGQFDATATIEVVVDNPGGTQPLRHLFSFRSEHEVFHIQDERIENEQPDAGQNEPVSYYRFSDGRPIVIRAGEIRTFNLARFNLDLSILAQLNDPDVYPEIGYLGNIFRKIRLYRDWAIGRDSLIRRPQKTGLQNHPLKEDFSNLGLFLNRLRRKPKGKQALLSQLRDLYEGLNDFDFNIEGGAVQVYFTEGDFSIPATRLSDGSLRYLCLLAILCDPTPPPLIGIEEPELGLHPDLLPKVADLLVEASKRCQLIVTTHSDILVDALSEQPESIVVCEKHDGQTSMRRLDSTELAPWLEKYRLGQLWTSGELGGTRW